MGSLVYLSFLHYQFVSFTFLLTSLKMNPMSHSINLFLTIKYLLIQWRLFYSGGIFSNCYVGVGVDLSGCLMLLLLSVRGAKKFHSIWKKQEKQRLWSSSEVTKRLLWILDKQRLFRAVTISEGLKTKWGFSKGEEVSWLIHNWPDFDLIR